MFNINYGCCLALGVLMICVSTSGAFSQHRVQHQAPTMVERGNTAELTFDVPGLNPGDVQDAFLYYRTDGSVSYSQLRMELRQSVFTVSLDIPSGDANSLEYYIQIQFIDGGVLTYPSDGTSGNPVRVEIVESRQVEQPQTGSEWGIEYTILSPEHGEEVLPEDVVIAITLFYDEGAIDTATTSFQLLLDEEDITEDADASAYFMTFVPDVLEPGEHTVSLRAASPDKSEEIVAWSFTVLDTDAPMASAPDAFGEIESVNRMPAGEVELMARNQVIAGNTNDALNGNVRLNGQQGNIRYSAYGLLTSQEDPRLQPQHRYGVELFVGDQFELQAGHIYPVLSPLTIAGQRVQGINAAFHPFDQALSVRLLYGKLLREISGIYGPVQAQPLSFNDVTVDTSYTLAIEDGGFGNFQRDLIGGRLRFGRSQKFQLGVNLLKVQDDTNSIAVISDYRDLINIHPDMAQNLAQEDRNKLEADPGLLNVTGNPVPKGNFVAGSDMAVNIHDNRIQFRADGAVSLLNEDISGGALTNERASELGFEMEEGVESLLDRLSWLIIINENITPLPLRFNVDDDASVAKPYFPTSVVAAQSELSFNYFKNNLRLQYRWVGPYFNSLANSTVRKDIAGFTISDRFRLLSNRIYVTLGYENLNDNVIKNKEATTNTVTLRGNISWYPVRQELPKVSIGLMNRSRENGVDLFNPYVPSALAPMAVRNFENRDGVVTGVSSARLANTIQLTSSVSQQFDFLGLNHDASLNFSLLNTSDDFYAYGDARSNSISFSLTNRFSELPLNLNSGFSYNNTQAGSGLTDIDILGFNMGGSVFLWDDRLSLDAALAFTRNKMSVTSLMVSDNDTPEDNTDDYYEPDVATRSDTHSNSYIISAGGRYSLDQNHAFVFNVRFTNVVSPLSNMHLPNDRLAQVRYIYSF